MGRFDADVIIIGGGPAGSTLASLMAIDGRRVLLLEQDIHPRDHVGEALVPSNNYVFERIGVLEKMDAAGFVRKEGVAWTAPRSPLWKSIPVRTADFVAPDAPRPYSYNVERAEFDAMLLRHAHELGAKIVQGARVVEVVFEDDRAIGVRASITDAWQRSLRAKVVVDATGRRRFLATQLGISKKDADFNQYCIWSWFRGVKPEPPGREGFVFFHFLGLERAWAWHIPLRDGIVSVGVVTDKRDFQKSGKSDEDFVDSLVQRNLTFRHAMEEAERIRPWEIVADYSYQMETVVGNGWLLVGDAFRFVDPIFASGIDVALHSALLAHEAITKSWETGDERSAFRAYERTVNAGVDVWYETVDLFYKMQQLFGRFALDRRYRTDVAKALQGNPYDPVKQKRTRRLLAEMRRTYEEVQADPNNLLRPGALQPPSAASGDVASTRSSASASP